MSDDPGFSLVALLHALGFAPIIFKVLNVLDDSLIASASQCQIQGVFRVGFTVCQRLAADAHSDTEGHREVRFRFDFLGFIQDAKLIIHQSLQIPVGQADLIEMLTIPHYCCAKFFSPATDQAIDLCGDRQFPLVSCAGCQFIKIIYVDDCDTCLLVVVHILEHFIRSHIDEAHHDAGCFSFSNEFTQDLKRFVIAVQVQICFVLCCLDQFRRPDPCQLENVPADNPIVLEHLCDLTARPRDLPVEIYKTQGDLRIMCQQFFHSSYIHCTNSSYRRFLLS